MTNQEHIRNFVIIAHIDHGKSTLADRFLEYTHTVEARKMKPQLLDQMDLERERGITIKMQPVRMIYHPDWSYQLLATSNQFAGSRKQEAGSRSNSEFVLNLIDTPGHIDFSYEVSRALAAVEGALLLVDASQGVQAQTLTNLHIAREQNLTIIPVINKIDLPEARVGETEEEIQKLLGCRREEVIRVSAKTGEGVPTLLSAVIERIPSPRITQEDQNIFRALIFDSSFDNHKGVITFVRVFDGTLKAGTEARLMVSGKTFEVKEVGTFAPARIPGEALNAGEIGYIVTGIKEPSIVRIGDTVGPAREPLSSSARPLPGYHEPQPVIWASFYPDEEDHFELLRDALWRLKLNDAALTFETESSPIMGRSFMCGFLGMLHMEIVTERLKREFSLSVIATSPSIAYEVTTKEGNVITVSSPVRLPSRDKIILVREPWLTVELIVPNRYLGDVLQLVDSYEGMVAATETFGIGGGVSGHDIRIQLSCEIPLRSVVSDFFDALKSVTSGYASLSYEFLGMRDADVERVDILVAGDIVLPLSRIVSRKKSSAVARQMVTSLKDILPQQLFQVKIQAVVASRIIASETLSALKKDVTGYLYGGDRTRKMKLWKKQKEGKKRLKETGRVHIPPEVYLKVLRKK